MLIVEDNVQHDYIPPNIEISVLSNESMYNGGNEMVTDDGTTKGIMTKRVKMQEGEPTVA